MTEMYAFDSQSLSQHGTQWYSEDNSQDAAIERWPGPVEDLLGVKCSASRIEVDVATKIPGNAPALLLGSIHG